jgi:hypothetical protein
MYQVLDQIYVKVGSDILTTNIKLGDKVEAEFLDVGHKSSEIYSLLFTVTSANGFYPLPLEQKWFETGLYCKHPVRKPQVRELS